jgi:hypothetical protein
MNEANPTPARSLRIRAGEVTSRLDAGEPVRLLDARSQKAWDGSNRKAQGAVRIRPILLEVQPDWDPAHLTVIYCA